MNAKELKIVPPEGYEVDWENSSMNTIRFKPIKKKITYQDVKEKLFSDKKHYVEYIGDIYSSSTIRYSGKNIMLALSRKQLEQLLALNKLMNVAKYLNGDWEPDWDNSSETKWCLLFDHSKKKIVISNWQISHYACVYFKSEELTLQAIDILGEDEVKKALGIFE